MNKLFNATDEKYTYSKTDTLNNEYSSLIHALRNNRIQFELEPNNSFSSNARDDRRDSTDRTLRSSPPSADQETSESDDGNNDNDDEDEEQSLDRESEDDDHESTHAFRSNDFMYSAHRHEHTLYNGEFTSDVINRELGINSSNSSNQRANSASLLNGDMSWQNVQSCEKSIPIFECHLFEVRSYLFASIFRRFSIEKNFNYKCKIKIKIQVR